MSEADRAFVGAIPETYERYLGPMLFEPFARDLARRFQGFQGALLEIAAGTGRLTRALAGAVAPGATIVATDLNEPMLTHAQQLIQAPNVHWRAADAQALPFEDASFQAVVCQFGVMFFPDKPAAYAEARRVLAPGGRYVFNVWDALERNEESRMVQDAVRAAFPDNPPTFFSRVPFGYNDPGVIEAALAEAGFRSVDIETVSLSAHSPSPADAAKGLCLGTPLRAELEPRGPGALEKAVAAAEAALRRTYGDGPVAGVRTALVVSAAVSS